MKMRERIKKLESYLKRKKRTIEGLWISIIIASIFISMLLFAWGLTNKFLLNWFYISTIFTFFFTLSLLVLTSDLYKLKTLEDLSKLSKYKWIFAYMGIALIFIASFSLFAEEKLFEETKNFETDHIKGDLMCYDFEHSESVIYDYLRCYAKFENIQEYYVLYNYTFIAEKEGKTLRTTSERLEKIRVLDEEEEEFKIYLNETGRFKIVFVISTTSEERKKWDKEMEDIEINVISYDAYHSSKQLKMYLMISLALIIFGLSTTIKDLRSFFRK